MADFDTILPRRHGFERPFDVFQYIAAFAYVLFTLAFCLLHAPLITPGIFAYVAIGLMAAWIPLSIATYGIAATAPVHDRAMEGERLTLTDFALAREAEDEYKCRECSLVRPNTSKHCWLCSKCIENFDHHCRWLNHCVGERNYLQFSLFLGNTFTLLTIQAALGWYFCVESASDFDGFHRRAVRAFEAKTTGSSVAIAVFMWLIALLELAVVLVLGQLFFLHVELSVRGITTWDLIQIKRRESALRKDEREMLGLDPGPPTPTCHDLIVSRRRRELRERGMPDPTVPTAGKYQATPHPDGASPQWPGTDSEPALTPKSSNASLRRSAAGDSFRRTHSRSSLQSPGAALQGNAAVGSGDARQMSPVGRPRALSNAGGSPQYHAEGQHGQYAAHTPQHNLDNFADMSEEYDDEDEDDELDGPVRGAMSASCTSVDAAGAGSRAFRNGRGHAEMRAFTPVANGPGGTQLPHARSMSDQISPEARAMSPVDREAGTSCSPQGSGRR